MLWLPWPKPGHASPGSAPPCPERRITAEGVVEQTRAGAVRVAPVGSVDGFFARDEPQVAAADLLATTRIFLSILAGRTCTIMTPRCKLWPVCSGMAAYQRRKSTPSERGPHDENHDSAPG